MGSIVNQLMARRGYAQVEAASELQGSVLAVVSSHVAEAIRVGQVKRGVLMIYAKDSPTMQELTFQQRKLLKRLQADHPQANISDVRFRVCQ
ncbi:DUF721 domain-containing protein [Planctomycetaceae bacterium SH139]